MAFGPIFPFAPSTGSAGYFDGSATELQAIESNIKSLFSTNWGERVMHPYFGLNLIEFCFEQISVSDLRQRITDRIIDQLSKWIPFVRLTEISVLTTEKPMDFINSNAFLIKTKLQYGNSTFVVEVLTP